MNLLGLQSQIVTDPYRTMVRATFAHCLKVIIPGGLDAGLLREWRSRRPDGLLVLRHYFPDETLSPTKYATILSAADQIADLHPILEVPINESSQTSADDVARLADYSASFVRLAADQGFKAGVGVFSEGNPSDLGWWERFRPALLAARQHGGYLCLHEYGVPSLGLEDWHLLRHRRVWEVLPEECRVPILVTEAGIDGGIEGRREVGWRGYMNASQYAAWLRAYHREVARDPYVHGVTLFLCGSSSQWASFDLADEVDLRAPLTESITGPPRWVPGPVTPSTPPTPAPTPAREKPSPATPGGTSSMSDVVLSVPMRSTHAADGNWGKGEPFGPVRGVVIHSTGGGGKTIETEYTATVNWFANPDAGVSAHVVVGAGKFSEVCRVLGDLEKAYHAREPSNTNRRGIEMAHPDGWDGVQYTAFQYEAAGELIARWKLADEKRGWVWPIKLLTPAEAAKDLPGLVYHRDLPAGIKDGRRDPTPPFDGIKLIGAATRWYAALAGGTTMPPVPTPASAVDIAKERDALWATAERLEKAGYAWLGQGIKALVATSKGEK